MPFPENDYLGRSTDHLIQSIREAQIAKNNTINNVKRDYPYPCSICNHAVKNNDKSIQCSTRELWVHIRCNGISVEEYIERQQRNLNNPELIDSEVWSCMKCVLNSRSDYTPFIFSSDIELSNLNSVDSMKLFDMLPNDDVQLDAFHTNQLVINEELDESNIDNINCKYISCNDFFNLDNSQCFNILHSNVNGYISKVENINEFLSTKPTNTKFDVICISETSLKDGDNIPDNDMLNGFNEPFTTNTMTSKGGVAIFTNNSNAVEREDLKIQNKEFEGVWIEITNKGCKNTIIGCIYRHPHLNNIDTFSEYINNCLIKLNKENKDVYMAGDFNIDLLKYDSNARYREFYNLMTSNGYLPLITLPTRLKDSTHTLIDNIFTNSFTQESHSGNILIEFAVHLSQFASISKHNPNTPTDICYKLDQSKFNENLFLEDLSIQNFEDKENANDSFSDLLDKYEACVKRHMPLKKVNKKEKKLENKPWLTKDILKKIKIRNNLFANKKKDPNNEYLKSAYNRFRNSVNNDIKQSKKAYYGQYFENCKNNMKKTWKGINDLIRSNNKSTKVNYILQNNQSITEPKIMANAFNNFFANVGPTIDKEIPKTPISPLSFLRNRVFNDFTFKETTISEVMTIVLKLDVTKSSGPSMVPINILRISAPILVPHLVKIFNLSFRTGIFPNLMKLAKVIPIFKAGSKFLVNNYRPISLLSVFSKIFEKIVHQQLFDFMSTNSVIFESQFGFQKGRSTNHSLIEIVENIRNCIDSSMYGCGIFIDLKKTFDTVNHEILVSKLEHYGVRGKSLEWFSSYLNGRAQYTFCNNFSSELKFITCGVPQGSVLGPLLFLLYINDLPNISNKLKFYLIADDTNIFYQSSNIENLQFFFEP